MKRIVYGVYHDVNKEARSREMLECFCKIGKVDFVSYAEPQTNLGTVNHIVDKSSPLALFDFIKVLKKTILAVQPDMVLLHDNDCSVLIPFIKKHVPKAIIFYDSSELYIPMPGQKKRTALSDGWLIRVKSLLTGFRKAYEKKYLKKADVVFAANVERAEIMKTYFGLDCLPVVFDNIHRIDDAYDPGACHEKFFDAFAEEGFNVLFAGGISEERKTFDYIQAFKKLGDAYNLIIVGTASAKALNRYAELTEDAKNIHYLGFITRAELRYCMTKSQASVVIFDQDSYNTKFCASGKCYESLFEGVPILASENPPLKRLCETYGIGISNDHYDEAVRALASDYSRYIRSVNEYVSTLNYEGRLEELTNLIAACGER